MPLRRVFALNAAKHLSLMGRYPAAFAVPDRWVSWRLLGVRAAIKLAHKFRPDVVWSTYPIATAHQIGAAVARRSGLPWVADMRDPMVEYDPYTDTHFPKDDEVRESRLNIEKDVIRLASRVVLCTEGARSICLDRYGAQHSDKYAVIPNGYDDASFRQVEEKSSRVVAKKRCGFVLLHSGTVYPDSDRGPASLFEALSSLRKEGELPDGFRLVLRGSGHIKYLTRLINKFRIEDLVELAPSVTYQTALKEMLESEALLVIQGPSSNPAIPAKLYEYFRARKPILGLLHPEGDTAALLQSLSAGIAAPLDDPARIASALKSLFENITEDRSLTISESDLPAFSRENQTGDLARLLDTLQTASSIRSKCVGSSP
jgi:hypothetical protein